jgi:hypothetical protein
VNPAASASAQPKPEDALPEDTLPEDVAFGVGPDSCGPDQCGPDPCGGESAGADESFGPTTPEEEAEDEYVPLWRGF